MRITLTLNGASNCFFCHWELCIWNFYWLESSYVLRAFIMKLFFINLITLSFKNNYRDENLTDQIKNQHFLSLCLLHYNKIDFLIKWIEGTLGFIPTNFYQFPCFEDYTFQMHSDRVYLRNWFRARQLPVFHRFATIMFCCCCCCAQYFWRRRNLIAKPLIKEGGIGSIIIENPFYGSRKPVEQRWVHSNLLINSTFNSRIRFSSPLLLLFFVFQEILSAERVRYFRHGWMFDARGISALSF